MTLNEFVRNGLHDLMVEAARSVAESSDDPDECAGVPMAFFHAENALWAAWLQVSFQAEEVT